jgi:hypothetical protein
LRSSQWCRKSTRWDTAFSARNDQSTDWDGWLLGRCGSVAEHFGQAG